MTQILLIEDDQWLGESYQLLLTKAGFAVTWCQDGYGAFDAIDIRKPDLIILDLLLPWANGLQVLHELQSHADLQSIPVLLCSNALPEGIRLEDLQPYGVVAMADKTTITPRLLIRTVRSMIHAKL